MSVTDRELTEMDGTGKREFVRGMFTAIAPRYDFLNHLLSLNLDRVWRRRAVARLDWERVPDGVYLDLCSGTMDLAAAIGNRPGFRGRVVGADFVHPMLARGQGKCSRAVPVTARPSARDGERGPSRASRLSSR